MRRQQSQDRFYNRNTRNIPTFEKGESVKVKVNPDSKEFTPAVVDNEYLSPRSYIITTNRGQTIRRNKRMMNKTPNKVIINPPYPDAKEHSQQSSDLIQQPHKEQPNSTPDDIQPNPVVQRRTSQRVSRSPKWHKDYVMSNT